MDSKQVRSKRPVRPPPRHAPSLSAAFRGGRGAALATALCLQGCSASPQQNILGSFFPSWLLCALIGVAVTVLVRWRLIVAGIDKFVPLALLTYAAMAFAITCLAWLIRFGN